MLEKRMVDGYKAAGLLIEDALFKAKTYEKLNKKITKSKEYKHGYYNGLLFAYCMLALGEFADQPDNQRQIKEILRKKRK